MSRSASKSRTDTRGPKTSVQVASPQSHEVDVVPGRLTQTQWEEMLRLEDADNIVEEIMEELMGSVMEQCLKTNIHKQLVVFSVSWAKDFLVQAMELAFLYRDEGDGPEEAFSGTEDSEPVPSPIDSWAQGCVPVVSIRSPPSPPPTTPHKAARLENTEPKSTPPCVVAQLISSTEQHEKDREISGSAEYSTQRVVTPTPPGKSNRKKKMKVLLNPNTAAKESIQLPRQSLSRLVIQGEQEEGNKRMVQSKSTDMFDSLHTSECKQPVSKRHHVLRPLHLVSPQYEILDTQLLPKRQTIHRLPVSGHKYNQQRVVSTTVKLKPLSNYTDKKAKLQQRRNAQHRSDFWLEPRNHSISPEKERGIMRFSGSLRLDTMDLVPGVSLSESQGLQKSPLTASIPVHLENIAELRPMRRYPALPVLISEQHSTVVPAQAMPLK